MIIKKIPKETLFIRQYLATAERGEEKIDLSISGGSLIIRIEGQDYQISLTSIIEDVIREHEKGGW